MNRTLIGAALLLLTLPACSEAVSGEPVDAGRISAEAPLPFAPTISERKNDRNNGTTFEPCTAYSTEDLAGLSIVASTILDAAQSDSPNFRGCTWQTANRMWSVGQTVGNESSLERYKAKVRYRTWLPDRTVNGRVLGIATDGNSACIAVFMSQSAIVASSAISSTKRTPEPDFKTECEMAVAFATLATTKAP